MRYVVKSDVGKKRTVNEDRAEVYIHSTDVALAVIADGMGGHNAGDVASNMLVDRLVSAFKEVVDEPDFKESDNRKEWLHETVLKINQEIFQYSLDNPACKGMGTTLDAALIYDGTCLICHAGDSRAYLIAGGMVKQLTKDHSYVNVLVESGEISVEQAENHPQKNLILKAIGSEKVVTPDFVDITLEDASILLLCSDGLSNKLSSTDIQQIIGKSDDLESAGSELIRHANERGGEDNITLILLTLSEEVHTNADR